MMIEEPVKLKYDVSHPFETAAATLVMEVVMSLLIKAPTQQLHDDVIKTLERYTEPKVISEPQA